MKKIVSIMALVAVTCAASAQSGRGIYGTVTPWKYQSGTIYNQVAGVPTPITAGKLDTLINSDTGYVYITFSNQYDFLFDFGLKPISGTTAGFGYLQGSADNTTWHTIKGDTSKCSDCVGAFATLGNTAKTFEWNLPVHSVCYPYYRVQAITTGTCTASYTGSTGYKY